MHQTLIVARLDPRHTSTVHDLFAESDRTELPHLVGVRQRSLFQYHGLYFHLIQADAPIGERLAQVREHPLYAGLNNRLGVLVEPYDPSTWRGPSDAMAGRFYSWQA